MRNFAAVLVLLLATHELAGVVQARGLAAASDEDTPDREGLDSDVPGPENLGSYYTAYPAPISVLKYLDALFTCEGAYALCSYATCVPLLGSDPPVAECGCYEFIGKSLGAGPGVLNQELKDAVSDECSLTGQCLTTKANDTAFCDAMNSGDMYPGYPLVSTYNPNDWIAATNQTGQVPAGSAAPSVCQGGTATNCFAAACRRGAPSSEALPEGGPSYNATCYCPYFTVAKEPFLMGNGTNPCGPTDAKELTSETLIYNGL